MRPEPIRLLSAPDEGLPPSLELAAYLYLPGGPAQLVAVPPAKFSAAGPPGRHPGLVVGHGAGSRAARHEEFCLEASRQGFAVLALDFRGHGSSQGKGDGPLEQDLLAAVRFLRGHPAVDLRSVCYRGSSMGGFYGLKAAPLAAFAAMVLVCPASESTMLRAIAKDDDFAARYDSEAPEENAASARNAAGSHGAAPAESATRWDNPRLRAYFERQKSQALAAQVHCPVLLVHARGDDVVPFTNSLALAEHLRGDTTLLALQGGSHTTAQHNPRIHSYSVEWLRQTIGQVGKCGPGAPEGN
jgi:dipeptidyl aminopeptidase/acylaminoacyl peptidase